MWNTLVTLRSGKLMAPSNTSTLFLFISIQHGVAEARWVALSALVTPLVMPLKDSLGLGKRDSNLGFTFRLESTGPGRFEGTQAGGDFLLPTPGAACPKSTGPDSFEGRQAARDWLKPTPVLPEPSPGATCPPLHLCLGCFSSTTKRAFKALNSALRSAVSLAV